MLERFGADALRYWAAKVRPGTDTTADEGQMRVGRRLAIKLLNSARFILGLPGDGPDDERPAEPLDLAMVAGLDATVAEATTSWRGADRTAALEATERSFWSFCDDYLELVRDRAYRPAGEPGGASARARPAHRPGRPGCGCSPPTCRTPARRWSWWRDGSVHRAAWPGPMSSPAAGAADRRPWTRPAQVIAAVRRAKS